MFDKFGEFDSAEEINAAAAGLLLTGGRKAVADLAEENGIEAEDAEDYTDGIEPELCTPLMAAIGKLNIEEKDLGLGGILKNWKGSVMALCAEDKELCAAVRKKGKSLKDCMAELVRYSFENKIQVDDRIVDAVKVNHNGKTEHMRKPLYLGFPDKAEEKRIIREYYMK